jgi:hypothetical protein
MCSGYAKAQKTADKDTRHSVDKIQIWYLKWKDKKGIESSEG